MVLFVKGGLNCFIVGEQAYRRV